VSWSARPTTSEPFAALAFNIMTDPYVVQAHVLPFYSGRLERAARALVGTGRTERIGRGLMMHATDRERSARSPPATSRGRLGISR